MPKVSVVMSVYNTKEEYLREAIESILNQTYKDFEFIILNDGSTNNAEEVILSYSDERIRYFKHENMGIGKTRNKAFSLANGEYIAVMDSDDISLPERFKKQVDFLNKNPDISILGSGFEFFPEKYILIHKEKPKFLDFLKNCCVGHPTVMYRKDDILKYGLKYAEHFSSAEDYYLWSHAIKHLNFYNLQEVLLKYRWHGENISVIDNEKQQTNSLIIQKEMSDFLTDDKDLQKQIYELITVNVAGKENISFLQQIFSIKNQGNHKVLRVFGFKVKFKRQVKNENH